MPGIPVRVRSVDGRSIFRLFGKPADGRLAGVCEIGVVCDYDTCRTSQQAAYYRPFDEHSFDGELGAAEKPGGHSAGDGTETEADDEVAQAKKRCLEVEPEDFMKIIENKELIQNIKNLGFRFVTLDLEGIRSGGYDIENIRNSTKG